VLGPQDINPKDPEDWSGGALYTGIAALIAASQYANPLHKELTYHYVYARGAPFLLTQDKMTQVIGHGSVT
jgi:hypothetical protein